MMNMNEKYYERTEKNNEKSQEIIQGFKKLKQKFEEMYPNLKRIDSPTENDIYDFGILGKYSKQQINLTEKDSKNDKEKLIQEKYDLIKPNLDNIYTELLDFLLFDTIDLGMQFWLDKMGNIAPFIDKDKLPENKEELYSFTVDRDEFDKLGTLKYFSKYLPYINLEKLKNDSKAEYLEIDNETSDGWTCFQFSSDKGIFFSSIVVYIDDKGNFADIQS